MHRPSSRHGAWPRLGQKQKRSRESGRLYGPDQTARKNRRLIFMALVSCNVCGADDYTVVFPKGVAQMHRIVRCNRCSLMYANPQEFIDCNAFDVYNERAQTEEFQ